jgi:hypothetical protein
MAYQDGTGPNGQGPRTGRGMGNCPPVSGNVNNSGWFGGFGRGWGRGRGFGRGFRRQGGFFPFGGGATLTKDEEKELLKQDISNAEEYVNSAQKRLSELNEE